MKQTLKSLRGTIELSELKEAESGKQPFLFNPRGGWLSCVLMSKINEINWGREAAPCVCAATW